MEWFANTENTSIKLEKQITELQEVLINKIDYWNGKELKFHFLWQFVGMVNFDKFDHYRSFLGRTLSAEVDGMMISGEVDFMVATGKQTPQVPFFLHEWNATRPVQARVKTR